MQRILARDMAGTGDIEIVPTTGGGAGYQGQIPGLDPVTGLLSINQMPVGIGPDVTTGTCGATSLTAGMYVNIYYTGGAKTIRPADATDATKPADGFVLAGFTVGQTVTVYLPGSLNNLIPVGSYTTANTGSAIYLSTAGAATLTRPTTPGALEQYLGDIDDVSTTVSSTFTKTRTIVCA